MEDKDGSSNEILHLFETSLSRESERRHLHIPLLLNAQVNSLLNNILDWVRDECSI